MDVVPSLSPRSAARLPERARLLIAGALILAACILAYAPVLHGQFLWDDLYLVGANPFFKSPRFALEVFRHYLFLDSFSLYYRPVQNLSYIVDYAIWNQDSFGYHLSNVLFHSASAYLLFLVVRRSLRAIAPEGVSVAFFDGAAFAISLIWAVHPIHNAAVAYVAGRADSLAMMFALSAWLIYTQPATGWRRGVLMVLAAFSVLVALCAKEIAFIWIALFAIYLFGFDRATPRGTKIWTVAALLGVLGIYIFLRHLPGPRTAQAGVTYPPMAERVLLMLRALGDYSSLIFYPGNLHMEREVWSARSYTGMEAWQQNLRAEYLSLAGLATIAGFIAACWSNAPGRRIRIFGVTWFVLGFLPISNLFPLNAQVAEHWIYMASAGYLILLAGCAYAIPSRHYRLLSATVPVAVLALGIRTAYRAADWADPETFFRLTIASGGFPERVSLNLADCLTRKGKLTDAEAVLRQTVKDFPDYPPARIQLGTNLVQQGRKDEAAQYLVFAPKTADMVAASTPQSWRAELNLAGIQFNDHRPTAALVILDDAVKRYPDVWDLQQYKSEVLLSEHRPNDALPEVQAYAGRNWWHLDSHLMLARIQMAAGDYNAALADCREAATLDIHNPAPYEQAARANVLAKQYPAAFDSQLAAIARGPGSADQYVMLAAILDGMNQPKEAAEAVKKADLIRSQAAGG